MPFLELLLNRKLRYGDREFLVAMFQQTLQVLTLPTKADRQRQPKQFAILNLKGKEELMIRLW